MIAPAVLEQWIERALPGETLVYAEGGQPPRALLAAARGAWARGQIEMHQVRSGSGALRYLARRTAAPLGGEAGGGAQAAPSALTPEGRILRVLGEAARRGRPCPTNLALARKAGLTGKVCASYRLRKLVRAGLIAIDFVGADRRRVVTIARTGLSTAGAA